MIREVVFYSKVDYDKLKMDIATIIKQTNNKKKKNKLQILNKPIKEIESQKYSNSTKDGKEQRTNGTNKK